MATATAAASALSVIDAAISGVDSQRASFGSALNRLNMSIANLSTAKINAEASRARVMDTDYAAETAELARTQIIAQAGIAMLSQANAQPQSVLSLLASIEKAVASRTANIIQGGRRWNILKAPLFEN